MKQTDNQLKKKATAEYKRQQATAAAAPVISTGQIANLSLNSAIINRTAAYLRERDTSNLQPYNRRFCRKTGKELEPHGIDTLYSLLHLHGETRASSLLREFAAESCAIDWLDTSPECLEKLRYLQPAEFLIYSLQRVFCVSYSHRYSWDDIRLKHAALVSIQSHIATGTAQQNHLLRICELVRRLLAIESPTNPAGFVTDCDSEATFHAEIIANTKKTLHRLEKIVIQKLRTKLAAAPWKTETIKAAQTRAAKKKLAQTITPTAIAETMAVDKGISRFALAGDKKAKSPSIAFFMESFADIDFEKDANGKKIYWRTTGDIEQADKLRKQAQNARQQLSRARRKQTAALLAKEGTATPEIPPLTTTNPFNYGDMFNG